MIRYMNKFRVESRTNKVSEDSQELCRRLSEIINQYDFRESHERKADFNCQKSIHNTFQMRATSTDVVINLGPGGMLKYTDGVHTGINRTELTILGGHLS